jgi:serine/threonine protein kinase
MKTTLPFRARFGAFELDLKAGELHRDGETILLQERLFQILRILVEHGNEIATREDIKKMLWPNDTVVEFDHAINNAIKKLRQVLGDSVENPQYIQTVARRGYRLLVPVEWLAIVDRSHDSANRTSGLGVLTGKRVSHYRVLEIVGGGGMGVVYQAEDLKLGRRVALKFLPEELASDPRALERFEREARAASALEHPNICSIYEFGEHEGQPFIAMQLLEGETLRERLTSGSSRERNSGASAQHVFPVEQLIDVASQITAGLEAAHAKGIIHRDIKPANIFLTVAGIAKILDFGAAKLIEFGAPEVAINPDCTAHAQTTVARTLTSLNLTRTGIALGTAGYMSPEQVRGEKLDYRTDLFSFGLVLYEMATGHRAFTGDTAAILHDAILNRKPTPARDINSALPSQLEPVINKALEKDRNARYQQASEISADLKGLKQETATRLRRWRMAVAGAFALVMIATGLWLKQRQPTSLPDSKLRQLTHSLNDNPVRSGAVSPDGNYLAYTDMKGIHVEQLDTGRSQSIPQPQTPAGRMDGWEIVQWFPDGNSFLVNLGPPAEFLASDSQSSIWRFSILGGSARKLRDDAVASSISPDGGRIFFVAGHSRFGYREIWQMRPDGDEPRKLFDAGADSEMIGPQLLADGKRLYYLRIDSSRISSLESRDLSGGAAQTVFKDVGDSFMGGRWLPDGRLLYILSEPDPNDYSCNIWELQVDLRTGLPSGEARRLTNWTGFCLDSFSTTSDGKRLAFLRWAGEGSIAIADLRPNGSRISSQRRLTPGEGRYRLSAWTPDSRAVIFLSKRNGQWGIYEQYLDRDTPESIVPSLPGHSVVPDEKGRAVPRISPDGSLILYTTIDRSAGSLAPAQLMRAPITGGASELVLTGNLYGPADCSRSPAALCAIAEQSQDLRQLVFTAFDPRQGRGAALMRLSIDPGNDYKWALSPDGRRIAVVNQSEGRIHIFPLDGKPAQELTVKGWNSLDRLAWAAKGDGFFVSSLVQQGSLLLHVDLHGNSQILWRQQGGIATWAMPSPDGHHLAIDNWTLNTNIWMMEDF